MSATRDLIAEVAQLLNDYELHYEYTRWSQAELLEYAQDAVVQLALLRPEQFVHTQTLTLVPGARQTLPEGSALVRVEGTWDASGRLRGQPGTVDARAARTAATWFVTLGCTSSANPYAVTSYYVDAQQPGVFYVQPPAPVAPPARIEVSVSAVPATLTLEDAVPVPARFHNAVVEWMLYRAFSKDQDSAHDTALSSAHLRHFYDMVGLSERADAALAGHPRSASAPASADSKD